MQFFLRKTSVLLLQQRIDKQKVRKINRISVQRDSPFADERLFLWRLMRGRCNVTTDAPSLVSSYP
ncbi:MAG: hypothetical protein MR627_04340, partial [Prevotella sp.]|nr:hypothetical protein [Prevotella sp.]